MVALFVSTPKIHVGVNQDNNQTARDALKEAFANKSFIYLTLGFFVCGWHIALVATHIPTYMADKGLPCLLYTSPSPRDQRGSLMPSSA